jgi:predicted ATPase
MSPLDEELSRPAPGEDWSALKSALRRFEDAWRQGPRPVIDDYLAGGEGLRHHLLIELVHVDLELRLKAGEAARVEEYLARYPELAGDRAAAVELMQAEYQLRRRGESDLAFDDYLRRFPAYRDELAGKIDPATRADVGQVTPREGSGSRPEPPPTVAGYEVLGLLGRGGMGVVYKARQLSLDRLVALKVLPEECAHDPAWLKRFRREALTASALNHPHICTIHDSGECAGRPFFSMELIAGKSLGELVGRRLPAKEVAHLVSQAARALAAAHAAGVVHRDVKPQNLMVRADGIVKVLDFGLARRLPAAGHVSGTDPGTLVGTVLYMSPEQVRGEAVGTPSDIFSLGLVLYELAAGRHPFPDEQEVGVLHAILAEEPLPPSRLNPQVPAPLEALISQMLAKDPYVRPTAAAVDAALTEMTESGVGQPGGPTPIPGRHPTVGRREQREALYAGFESAAAGRGVVLCVTGEPGLGKTTVVEDFLHELADGGRWFSLARGRCSERLAGAEAYLPFLEALDGLLHAEGGASAARVMQLVAPSWYVQLAPQSLGRSDLAPALAEARGASQERRKRELGMFLQEVTRLRPLVLFLDDVHWADPSSVDLLAYLGGKCPALRMLLVLTYRPSDLQLNRHPFGPVQRELQGRGVCHEIALPYLCRDDLDRYLTLAFVEHQFPEEFAVAVHDRTGGNPLFMVDLLRYLRDRGVLAADQGRWAVVQPLPDLRRDLPESVRSMVRRKVDQLGEADRRLLMAASVQGTEFDSAVVAQILSRGPAEVEEALDALVRVHALVRLVREHEFPDGTVSLRYRFVHVLYQNALYDSLVPARRAAWSAAAALAVLGLHGKQAAEVAGELAVLFEAAREFGRAAGYFLQAAENAVRVSAHREAIVLARRGLQMQRPLSPSPERAEQELHLQLTLGLQLQLTEGFAAQEARHAYARARELCAQVPESPLLYPVLWGLFLYHKARSELATARELAGELHALAEQKGDPGLTLQSHQAFAVTTLCLGEPAATRDHMGQAEALYDPLRHQSHTFLFGQDVGLACKAFGAVALWLLGHPDQAVRKSRESVTLAGGLSQPSSKVLAFHFAAMLHQCRRESRDVAACTDVSIALSEEHRFSFWHAGGMVLRGWALSVCGSAAEGVAVLRQGLEAWQAIGSVTYQTYYLTLLADVLGREGLTGEAQDVVDDALALAGRTGERFFQAELHRLQGLLLLQAEGAGGQARAEASFRQSLEVAHHQGAKSLALRSATSLGCLYQRQGARAEARRVLAEIYGGFTEGFDTPDLMEARDLLDRLA